MPNKNHNFDPPEGWPPQVERPWEPHNVFIARVEARERMERRLWLACWALTFVVGWIIGALVGL